MSGRAFVSRFSPNRTDPALLEAIFVQRHALADQWLGLLRDSILTDTRHHLLAVGPRGCGKSHLVSLLVSRLRKDEDVRERVRIAWLPEDETTPSFWKFLLRIQRALSAEYPAEFPAPPRDQLADATDDRRATVMTDYLLQRLDGRTLLVVVENLDDVLRGLKDEGQKRWRAFLQERRVATTLATSQQLTEDVSDQDRPFFNFFQLEHLQPLSTDDALSLVQKIAEHTGNTDLAAFLQTSAGRPRVRAIRHLAGGSHRVFIILSEFATREKLDNLVVAFEELLDELTPYYQERLRWLPDQQREIVELLCRQTRTVQVREIAADLFLTEQTASAQLKSLRDKGYVASSTLGRESRYELAEPLMRLCVEVKDPRREPIRLIVEFLRVWYERGQVEAMLDALQAGNELVRRHLQAALMAINSNAPDLVEHAEDHDLEIAKTGGNTTEAVIILTDIIYTTNKWQRAIKAASELEKLGKHTEALQAYSRVESLAPDEINDWLVSLSKANILCQMGKYCEAEKICSKMNHDYLFVPIMHGFALMHLGRFEEALRAYEHYMKDAPNAHFAWCLKGEALNRLGRPTLALAACERAIELKPDAPEGWWLLGDTLHQLGRDSESLHACNKAVDLAPDQSGGWEVRGWVMLGLMQLGAARSDFLRAKELDPLNGDAHDGLAQAAILSGEWQNGEVEIIARSLLPNGAKTSSWSKHLPDILTAILRSSSDRATWAHRAGRVADIAADAKKLPDLADSLVRSLTRKAYTEVAPAVLDAWAGVWREVAVKHPDLSLAARLFGVGVRYVKTKDARVLLDLLQEERSILAKLFGLAPADDDR